MNNKAIIEEVYKHLAGKHDQQTHAGSEVGGGMDSDGRGYDVIYQGGPAGPGADGAPPKPGKIEESSLTDSRKKSFFGNHASLFDTDPVAACAKRGAVYIKNPSYDGRLADSPNIYEPQLDNNYFAQHGYQVRIEYPDGIGDGPGNDNRMGDIRLDPLSDNDEIDETGPAGNDWARKTTHVGQFDPYVKDAGIKSLASLCELHGMNGQLLKDPNNDFYVMRIRNKPRYSKEEAAALKIESDKKFHDEVYGPDGFVKEVKPYKEPKKLGPLGKVALGTAIIAGTMAASVAVEAGGDWLSKKILKK